ncbi:MAG TPA: peptidoglycan DD-metalloendopeptidase family protein [Paucimonas sp.]|nr:peptidoglycan DD-metalloendopeptidase family protein [Paucimonas sp.]
MAAFLCALALPAEAAKVTERSKQKRAAESERAELQQKLHNLKREIDRTESAKGRAADALAHSEAAISDANRALRELAAEQAATEARLEQLSKQQDELAQTIDRQQRQLARLLREQYVSGNEDRLKLLLSGDNPNRVNRELQYMGYVSQAQAKLLESLRANLASVEANKAEIQNAKDELDEIAEEAQQQKAVLEKEKAQRASLLAQLSNKLASQRKEAGTLQRDEQRLAGLVEKLGKLIEEQQKAEAAARAKEQERRRQEQLAKAQKEQDKRRLESPKASAKGKSVNPNAIDDDEPPAKSLARNELTPEAGIQDASFPAAFESLRGKLRLPVKGDVIAKFGGKRGDGPSWKGLFIRAAEGADIKAIAGGRVVFADWLRGFGNLVIVDHGNQYLSIYGNNQAVLKRAGDAVKAGDTIASAGNSGGNEQSGLYFEMRHQGRAIDPFGWITLR